MALLTETQYTIRSRFFTGQMESGFSSMHATFRVATLRDILAAERSNDSTAHRIGTSVRSNRSST